MELLNKLYKRFFPYIDNIILYRYFKNYIVDNLKSINQRDIVFGEIYQKDNGLGKPAYLKIYANKDDKENIIVEIKGEFGITPNNINKIDEMIVKSGLYLGITLEEIKEEKRLTNIELEQEQKIFSINNLETNLDNWR